MEELINKLNSVPGSYFGFVAAISTYAKKKQSRLVNVLKYLNEHPNATTSDVIEFVSDQPDFFDKKIEKVG